MANIIELNQSGFQAKITSMEQSGKNITTKVNMPELTGEMPALEKYIQTYGSLKDMFKEYKALVEEDVKRLKGAQDAMTYAESQLIKK